MSPQTDEKEQTLHYRNKSNTESVTLAGTDATNGSVRKNQPSLFSKNPALA
jgi:hypothetical protein